MLPAAALYIFAVIIPSVQGGAYSLTDWDGVSTDSQFVGLRQYVLIFTDPYGQTAVKNTVLITVVVTIVQNLLGFFIALGVNARIKSRNILRVLFFAPVVITSIAIGFLWQNLFAPNGAINQVLELVGLGALRQDWLGNADLVVWSIMIVIIWQNVGYSMVIFLAGLQGVPEEVLEAAAIDGAGPVRRTWHVVRPMLAPAITINVMLSVIGGFKIFDQVFTMTKGGPGGASNTISTLIYQNAFQLGRFGYGAALGVVLTVFVAVASVIQYRLLSKQEG
ncbi:carbohydrate ABC transporter permease [Propioniciclava soli]|nr:sugar ABC transporter permease [Propioniciclava soli]